MIITWDKIERASFYVLYRSDDFNLPNGPLSDGPVCVCDGRYRSEPDLEWARAYVDSNIIGYLEPPDGYEFYDIIESVNFANVPSGYYVIVAGNRTCLSTYSNVIFVGDNSASVRKTWSVYIPKVDKGETKRNIRYSRWGAYIRKITFSFTYSGSTSDIDINIRVFSMDNLILNRTITEPSLGDNVFDYEINYYHPPDNWIVVEIDGSGDLGASFTLSNINVTFDIDLNDYPREDIIDAFTYNEILDRFSFRQIGDPVGTWHTIGHYDESYLHIERAYKSGDGFEARLHITYPDSSTSNISIPIAAPLDLAGVQSVDVQVRKITTTYPPELSDGNVFVKTSNKMDIDFSKLPKFEDVYFDALMIRGSGEEARSYDFYGRICYLDIYQYDNTDTESVTLTIESGGASTSVPILPHDNDARVFIDIPFTPGQEIKFTVSTSNDSSILDIRYEVRKDIPNFCERVRECLTTESDDAGFPYLYEFEDTFIFEGARGERYRTYPWGYKVDKIHVSPHRNPSDFRIDIYEDGNLIRSLFSSDFDEDLTLSLDDPIIFDRLHIYKVVLSYTDFPEYEEGPLETHLYMYGKSSGALITEAKTEMYEYIERHIPSSGLSMDEPASIFTFSEDLNIAAFSIVTRDGDDPKWRISIPDYGIDLDGTGIRLLELDSPVTIPAGTAIYVYTTNDFPTIIFHIKGDVSMRLEEDVLVPTTSVFLIRSALEHSVPYLMELNFSPSTRLVFEQFEFSLEHPPESEIVFKLFYSTDGGHDFSYLDEIHFSPGQIYADKRFSLDISGESIIFQIGVFGGEYSASCLVRFTGGLYI